MRTVSRRCFCCQLGGGIGAAALVTLGGCTPGTSSPVTSPDGSVVPDDSGQVELPDYATPTLPVTSGTVTFSFAAFPNLATVGGAAIANSQVGPFAAFRTGDSTATAMTAICTHQGCTVTVIFTNPAYLKCPCHFSEFDSTGSVMHGPAQAPLALYTAEVTATGIVVTVG